MAGKIDISALNTPPGQAEFETAKFFAALGKDITFIRASSIPNQHSPDILMDGVEWEIKCPEGHSKRTIESNFRKAVKQSKYIIFDLRRVKMAENLCIAQLKREFNARPYLKRLYIIMKSGTLLKIPDYN